MAKISIVVPVYNTEKYINQCVDSLINQTFQDIEVILVDDGSPDNSPSICDQYALEDDRVKVIHKKNAGVSEARNSGIDAATGEFLMFVDSDDWMEPEGCRILCDAYLKSGADTVVADVFSTINDKKIRKHVFDESFTTDDQQFIKQYIASCLGYGYNPRPYLPDRFNLSGLGSPWNKLYSHKIIEDNQLRYDPYVKGIYDDNLFTMHYLMHAKKIAYVSEPVYDYRSVPESLTNSFKANTLEISERIFQRIDEFINKQDDPGYFRKPSYIYVMRRLSQELGVYYFSPQNPKSQRDVFIELKTNLQKEPYKSALLYGEPQKMMMAHRTTYYAAKANSPTALWALFKGRRFIKNKVLS